MSNIVSHYVSCCVGNRDVVGSCLIDIVRSVCKNADFVSYGDSTSGSEEIINILSVRFTELFSTMVNSFSSVNSNCLQILTSRLSGLIREGAVRNETLKRVRFALDGCNLTDPIGSMCTGDICMNPNEEGVANELVSIVRNEQQLVASSVAVLLSCASVDGTIDVLNVEEQVSLRESVMQLQTECSKFVQVFSSLRTLVEAFDREQLNVADVDATETSLDDTVAEMESSGIVSLIHVRGLDEVVTGVMRCLNGARREREKNVRLQHELRCVLQQTSNVPAPASSITSLDCRSSATQSDGRCSASENPIVSQKSHLLLSLRDFVDTNSDGSRRQSIVRQVQEHIAAKTEELCHLREAASKSIKALCGDAPPSNAQSHDVANALLAVVKTTSDSIGDMRALLSGAEITPNVSASALRKLPAKKKPKPVGHRSTLSGTVSLKRSIVIPSRGARTLPTNELRALIPGRGVSGGKTSAQPRTPKVSVHEPSEGFASSENTESRPAESSSSQPNIQDVIGGINERLYRLSKVTDACRASLMLLGDTECDDCEPEDLAPHLFHRMQELHEALKQTEDIDLYCKVNPRGTDSTENMSVPIPITLPERLSLLVGTVKSLQNENESMRQQEKALERQRTFLLDDADNLRRSYKAEVEKMKRVSEILEKELQQSRTMCESAKEQNATLHDQYNKVVAECSQLELRLSLMHTARDDVEQSISGLMDVVQEVSRASEAIFGRIFGMEQGLVINLAAPFGKSRALCEEHVEEASSKVTALDMDRTTNTLMGTVARILSESCRTLQRCERPLQQLEGDLGVSAMLHHSLQERYLLAKEDVVRAEHETRGLMRDTYRNMMELLRDKSRAIQQRNEARQESDEAYARWQRRFFETESAHEEQISVLQSRLSLLRDAEAQRDAMRTELARWQARRETDEAEVSRLRSMTKVMREREEELRAQLHEQERRTREMELAHAISNPRLTREAAVMTEHSEMDLGVALTKCPPVASPGTELCDSVVGDSEVLQLRGKLKDALEYARHHADDAARCRALLLEQLAELDCSGVSVSELSLLQLIENHRQYVSQCIKERGKLLEAWQVAQNDISQLKQHLMEKDRQHRYEAEELELTVSKLRSMVQRKLEEDQITERNMANMEVLIEHRLTEVSKYAAQEAAMMEHIRELRRLLQSKVRMRGGPTHT
ncbi:hypothetical protein TRVL_09259 [Trypanosoma vivax]|nr:hypothetical protein TRVL_09259 [Trypanosoma vivax]